MINIGTNIVQFYLNLIKKISPELRHFLILFLILPLLAIYLVLLFRSK